MSLISFKPAFKDNDIANHKYEYACECIFFYQIYFENHIYVNNNFILIAYKDWKNVHILNFKTSNPLFISAYNVKVYVSTEIIGNTSNQEFLNINTCIDLQIHVSGSKVGKKTCKLNAYNVNW